MEQEFFEDARSVIRAYKLLLRAKEKEAYEARLQNLKLLSISFEKKWNERTNKNYKMSEWIRFAGKEREKNEQIYKGTR